MTRDFLFTAFTFNVVMLDGLRKQKHMMCQTIQPTFSLSLDCVLLHCYPFEVCSFCRLCLYLLTHRTSTNVRSHSYTVIYHTRQAAVVSAAAKQNHRGRPDEVRLPTLIFSQVSETISKAGIFLEKPWNNTEYHLWPSDKQLLLGFEMVALTRESFESYIASVDLVDKWL